MSLPEFFHFMPLATVVGEVGYLVMILASAASAYVSYDSSKTAAKQAEYNAEAQAEAIAEEQKRQAAQEAENQRRAVQEQRRFRAQQLAAMGASGAMLGTGSPLAIEADTWAKQTTELADSQRMQDLAQRQLGYERTSTLQMGAQEAAMHNRNATGAAISGLASVAGSTYSAFSTRPQTGTPQAYNRNTRQPMAGGTTV